MLRPEQLRIDRVVQRDGDEATWQVQEVYFEGFSSLITIRLIGTTSADEPPSLSVRALSSGMLERGAKVNIAVIGRAHRMPS